MNLVKTTILIVLFLLCLVLFYKHRSNFKRVPDILLGFAGILVVALVWSQSSKESFQSTCPQRALVDDIIYLRNTEYIFDMAADMKVSEQNTAFYTAMANLQTLLRGLYNAKTKECWRCFVDICLWMMNYNSVLFPNGTKANTVQSLATPAERRNNFAELLKQPEYSYINDVEPRFFEIPQSSGLAITTLNNTIKPGLVRMNFETMWGFLFHLSTQTQMFLMCIRVNSPESDVELHKDIDDIFKWFEKVAYFLHESTPLDNNIGFSQQINITMACLMNCRDLKPIAARIEAFVRYNINYEEAPEPNPWSTVPYNYIPPFEIIPDPTKTWNKRGITDADRQILQGYIWSESWREYKILNYQALYMKVLWPFMMIMQETKTPFNRDAFKVNLLKVVRNTTADLVLEKAYKDKGLVLGQFLQIMKNFFTNNANQVITLDALLAEIDKGPVRLSSVACLAPSANEIKTKVINTSDTVSTICSTFTNTTECSFTPINVKLLMYYSVCGKLAKYGRVIKQDQCIWASSAGAGTDQNFYNYFYEGKAMPVTFGTLYLTDLPVKDFIDALRLWVGTEKSVFPT